MSQKLIRMKRFEAVGCAAIYYIGKRAIPDVLFQSDATDHVTSHHSVPLFVGS